MKNYNYALVGSSTDKYLWILSRTPTAGRNQRTRHRCRTPRLRYQTGCNGLNRFDYKYAKVYIINLGTNYADEHCCFIYAKKLKIHCLIIDNYWQEYLKQ